MTGEAVDKAIVFSNWKMNKTLDEAVDFIGRLAGLLGKRDDLVVIMCIPYTYIGAVSHLVQDSCIAIGSENMHAAQWGAFTGEISAPMLASVGCTHVLLGHSERRAYFGETDEAVGRKMLSAVRNGMIPIVCIGETLEEREAGRTREILEMQVKVCLEGVPPSTRICVAYEPRWAIGTGRTPEYGDIEKTHVYSTVIKGLGQYKKIPTQSS